ncbi:putative DNA-binding protein (MmcQ/YjbR family) [Mycetocola sp. CAN_C7]|uniref:MmcQ/YjbR family DNA-binding protein n=1 Tax=Mycetocola sp. CAN_C7 TaxID=2787724 RepID=UPI0018CB6DBB
MEHPKLFDPSERVVDRVRAICADYPEFAEREAWGRPTFRAGKKLFVVMGSSMDRPHTMVFKPDPDERPALLDDDRFFVPPYFGPAGWLGMDLSTDADWTFVAELIDTSYRQVALKRQLAALDERHLR